MKPSSHRKEVFSLEDFVFHFFGQLLAPLLVGLIVATYSYWLNHR